MENFLTDEHPMMSHRRDFDFKWKSENVLSYGVNVNE